VLRAERENFVHGGTQFLCRCEYEDVINSDGGT
jgi:hypothetical protein